MPRKINRNFNTWPKAPSASLPPVEAIYSDRADQGTAKAVALLAKLTKPGGKMPVPPPLPRRVGR